MHFSLIYLLLDLSPIHIFDMEFESKRKKKLTRSEESAFQNRDRFKKSKAVEESAAGGSDGTEAPPSEEEVEEFFAILRRMKEAVKYFDDKGKRGREWREALEQAEVRVDYGGDDADDVDGDGEVAAAMPLMKKTKKETKEEEVIISNNDVLDLNAVAPEAEENGGA